MEKAFTPIKTFKERINTARQRSSALLLLGTGILWAFVLLIFTDYFRDANLAYVLFIIGVVNSVMIVQVLYRHPPKWLQILMHCILHLALITAFPMILPPLSPFGIYVAVFSIWVYIDFGRRALYASLIFQFIGLLTLYYSFGLLVGAAAIIEFAAFYSIIMMFTYFMSIFFDITTDELDAVESSTQEIAFERERLSALVGNMDDAVLACDSHFRIALHNPATLGLLNTHDRLQNKPLDKYLTLVDGDDHPVSAASLVSKKVRTTISTDYRLRLGEDDYVNLYIAITSVKDSQSTARNYVVVLRDITKEKSLEEERDEFISIMSHELRTPISIVEGGISLAQLLLEKGNTQDLGQYLAKSHDQTVMLAEIVNSLSALVQHQTASASMDVSDIDLGVLADTLRTVHGPVAKEKQLGFSVHVAHALPAVTSNSEALLEVVNNIASNAIKYTLTGSVRISIDSHDERHIAITIKDTGIGMSTADQKHIFEKFWRSEDFHTRESGGTGLGLYLSKKLADSIKVRISVSSKHGHGSTFTLIVPTKQNR